VSKTLMIVDDSELMRFIIMRIINVSGLEFDKTEEACNGVDAMEKLKKSKFDIMLCDINMPEMNGFELVKKVRQNEAYNDIKIIMVSADSSQELIDSVIADGANGFICKPFTSEKFQEKMSPFMN